MNFAIVLWIFFRYGVGLVKDYEQMKRSVLASIMRGLPQPLVATRAHQFFRQRQIPSLRQDAIREITRHRKAGRRLFIISSTLDYLADPVGESVQITSRFNTRLEIIRNLYTGRVLGPIYYGARKGELLQRLAYKENLDLERSFAYGDSIQDAAMLEQVGRPCAVNPDRVLNSLARHRRWPIVRW